MARPSLALLFFLLATSTFAIAMGRVAPEIAPAPSSIELEEEKMALEIAPAPFSIQLDEEKGLERIILGPFAMIWCIPAIVNVTGCSADLSNSYATGQVHVSKECCNAISDVSDSCFSIYGSAFAFLLRQFCDSL